jgi:tRNA nucleotidyltransferase (CCA-adding enzyme)
MRLILTHEQPDFDALASVALATVLFPGAVGVLGGQLERNIDELLRLYRDQIPLLEGERVDLREVEALIMVDTADARRMGRFAELNGRVPITIFDHHPATTHSVGGAHGIQEPVGATVTLLCRRLEQEGVPLPAPLASLALLGLHEDTGDLTFDQVTPDDHRAAAYLLRQGANLAMLRRFRSSGTHPELYPLRDEAIAGADIHNVAGRKMAFATLEPAGYPHGLSNIAADLLHASGADAAFLLARVEGKTLVFARAEVAVDVACVLSATLEGGGHPRAAFGRSTLPPEELRNRLLAALPRCLTPPKSAREVMSQPVLSIRSDARVADAHTALMRSDHGGMPVLDEAGSVVGVVSRRDLERAQRLGLTDAVVQGFMTRPAVCAAPSTTTAELEALVVKHNIGRVPIMDEGELVGIVTRSDLIRARHPGRPSEARSEQVLQRLPSGARALLDAAVAELPQGVRGLYLVGGSVRDGLLGVGTLDLDLVVEGATAANLASALQRRFGGRLALHPSFQTATLTLPDGSAIDLATARAEAYAHPGALPEVREGLLRDDLQRRDFSVNAIALRLSPEPRLLLDPFGGIEDIEHRSLRLLHALSFVEDPTRMVRGARLAGRLGFSFDADTRAKARGALIPEVTARVSGQRLRAELELTLSEARVAPALRALANLGALVGLYGFELPEAALEALDEQRAQGELAAGPNGVRAYLLTLLAATAEPAARAALERFHYPQRLWVLRERICEARQPEAAIDSDTLGQLEAAGRSALAALEPTRLAAIRAFEHAPPPPQVRGRDVVALGLAPGPAVGDVLRELSAVRRRGELSSYEAERAWVEELVRRRLASHPELALAPAKKPEA